METTDSLLHVSKIEIDDIQMFSNEISVGKTMFQHG